MRTSPDGRVASTREAPKKPVTAAAPANTDQSGSPNEASTAAGIVIATARIASRMPMTKKMGRRSITGVCRPCYDGPASSVKPADLSTLQTGARRQPVLDVGQLGESRVADHGEEFAAGLLIAADMAEHAAGDQGGTRLMDATG